MGSDAGHVSITRSKLSMSAANTIPTCAHCGHQDIVMQPRYPQPLALTGVLDQFESFHTTPCLGIEFPKADLAEWLRAPNSDEIMRDLAITSTYSTLPAQKHYRVISYGSRSTRGRFLPFPNLAHTRASQGSYYAAWPALRKTKGEWTIQTSALQAIQRCRSRV